MNDLEALISGLSDGVNSARQAYVIEKLQQMGSEQVIDALIDRLASRSYLLRRDAAAALALLGQPEWQERVTGYAADFVALAKTGDPRFIAPIRDILRMPIHDNGDWNLQMGCMEALRWLCPAAVDVLRELSRETDWRKDMALKILADFFAAQHDPDGEAPGAPPPHVTRLWPDSMAPGEAQSPASAHRTLVADPSRETSDPKP